MQQSEAAVDVPLSALDDRSEGFVKREFLIGSPAERCVSCWACARVCPARAIRVADQRSELVEERCIRCGACVRTCGRGGFVVRDDLPEVREVLASERPVVAILATEFVAAMHPMTQSEIEGALEGLGFHAVETTLLGEEMVALGYEQLHADSPGALVIRSTCPVAVAWVRQFHPALVSALAPIVPPYVAQARLIKKLYADNVAVVYVSPCYARKDELRDSEFAGAVDVAVDFFELKRLLANSAMNVTGTLVKPPAARRPTPAKEISLTDGYPRSTLSERDLTSQDFVAVRGVDAIEALLTAVERGEAAPVVIDMLYCDGCADGPATGSDLSVYAKRALLAQATRTGGSMTVNTRTLLAHLPSVNISRSFTARPAMRQVFNDEQIDACLAEAEFLHRDDLLDCGACGYDSCTEHAQAILNGYSTWDVCAPLQRSRLERSYEALKESATLDALTGLWNRRAFSERLEMELARFWRYGTPLTLLMIDLDGLKVINDEYGHPAGDAVLAEVARVMRDAVRETDAPARYGGDEFALILPGITKTVGYAVAEKIRTLVSSVQVPRPNGDDGNLSVSISVGLASATSAMKDSAAFIEAADRALYRAKAHGRDQVRIAPD